MIETPVRPETKPSTAAAGTPLPLERLYYWERNSPDKLCFTQPLGGGRVTEYNWGEAADQIRRMANYLKQSGLQPGERVAIFSKNCAHWLMCDYAIWMAGGVSVPLYPTLNADMINTILAHSGATYLFIGKLDGWENVAEHISNDVKKIGLSFCPSEISPKWEEIMDSTEPMTGHYSGTHEDLATIIYTSGTTGMPKGVMHTFGGIASAARNIGDLYDVGPRDRFVSYLPLAHVAERMCIQVGQAYCGSHVFFCESLDTFAQDLQRARPTIFFGVPRIWTKFQAGVFTKLPQNKLNILFRIPLVSGWIKNKIRTQLGLNEARFCLSAGANIAPSLLEWYRNVGIELLELYGQTENLGYSHSSPQGMGRVGYVGRPNPEVDVKLSPQGEVLILSPTNMKGYYNDPEKTAETFDQYGYLRTGDLGEIDDAGNLKITGRSKEIFKTSKGKYVAPFPIEEHILASPHVEQTCVMGEDMPQPLALIQLTESLRNRTLSEEERAEVTEALQTLFDDVNQKVQSYERLHCMIVVAGEWTIDSGLLTPTLKIQRPKLEAAYKERVQALYENPGVHWE